MQFQLEQLFGKVPLAQFIGEYLHRLPLAMAGSARGLRELGTWDVLGAILPAAGADAFSAREGQWGPVPSDERGARSLCDEGYTVFVRHAERHDRRLAAVAEAFEQTFRGAVNIHFFATPAGAPGFSWHYDAEDVFIVQTAGEKEYSLRKNTVNPWPLEETLPADMQYERELMPLMRARLGAGDLLYIPCGYWHRAEALGCETGSAAEVSRRGDQSPFSQNRKSGQTPAALSLAIGVMSRTAMDVHEFLRHKLVESLVWRQRLPLSASGG